jgi:hypothetical protein
MKEELLYHIKISWGEYIFMSKRFYRIIGLITLCFVLLAIGDAYYKPYFNNGFRKIPTSQPTLTHKPLTISGSSSYGLHQLQKKLAQRDAPVYVVDLQEKANLFLAKLPEHWYGYDKDGQKKSWQERLHHYSRRVALTGKFSHYRSNFKAPEQLIKDQGFSYVSLLQTRKKVPDQAFIDDLIKFLKSLPNQAHLHIYCREGKGRTSIVMLMIDIWRTQAQVDLANLIESHHKAGSENLFDTTVWQKGSYTKEMLESRKTFILQFYQDVKDGKYPIQ